jgi:signal transduction histidine kinase
MSSVMRRPYGLFMSAMPAIQPAARTTTPSLGRFRIITPTRILIGATLGSIPFMLFSIGDVSGARLVWDNAHWSISAVGAVLAIVWSVRGSAGRTRTVRRRAAAAFGFWAFATLAWAWMNFTDTVAVPSITDVFIVAIVFPGVGVLVATVRGRLSIAEEAAVYLDAALGFLLVGSLIVYVFGPTAFSQPTAASVAALAYPSGFIGLGGSGLIAILAIGYPIAARGSFALLAGCVLIGVAYLGWLAPSINLADPGEASSMLFTIGTLMAGYGAATWEDARSTNRRFLTAARGATRIIAPLVVSLLFLLMLAPVHDSIQTTLRVGMFVASIVFIVREGLLLRERTNMLSAMTALTTENGRLVGELRDELKRRAVDERRLIQASRAAAVGNLAAGVAHEVNNPLTGVLGFAELLIHEMAPDDPHLADVRTIRDAALRARAIVRALRDFGNPRPPELAPTDLSELVGQTVDLIRYSIESRGITIDEDLPSLEPIEIDRDAVQQAVLNILTNARQAVADGGRMAVSVRPDGDGRLITITDDGIGMDAATAQLAFDPFFSGRDDAGVEPAAGLGLSVSSGLVESHGGTISIHSRPGRGTTVEIRLPAGRPDTIDEGRGVKVA